MMLGRRVCEVFLLAWMAGCGERGAGQSLDLRCVAKVQRGSLRVMLRLHLVHAINFRTFACYTLRNLYRPYGPCFVPLERLFLCYLLRKMFRSRNRIPAWASLYANIWQRKRRSCQDACRMLAGVTSCSALTWLTRDA